MKSVHVLLVEDNEGDIRLTQEALRDCPIEVRISVARNGEEALDFVFQRGKFTQAEKPDIILLDINMPLLDGKEVLRTIKADKQVQSIPVIMLTTSSSKEDIGSAYINHANAYITKPGDILKFIDIISTLMKFWSEVVTLPNSHK